jgi:hypothetical protein
MGSARRLVINVTTNPIMNSTTTGPSPRREYQVNPSR